VADLLSGIFKGFPNFTVDIDKTYHPEDTAILEIRMKGTTLGDWVGLKAAGRSMDIPVVCIFEFDGDRLLCGKVYFDMATLVNQLTPTTNK
jgi:predicted ester cyclase